MLGDWAWLLVTTALVGGAYGLGRRGRSQRLTPSALPAPASAPSLGDEERLRLERLQGVVDALEQPLYVTDARFELVMANRACWRFYGLEPSADLSVLGSRE